ncbi:cyclopropane fatty acyl phospholipid synthase [Candidatus Uhrbacteria bacterium]|nr:cyclopropane fatty acyl phospholipid synthase [Candidatus Uhrbacteria bacterium]
MNNSHFKKAVKELIAPGDIKINGTRDWDIQVHNERFYSRVLSGGSLGLGESYMDGWWDVRHLDQFMERILLLGLDKKVQSWRVAMAGLLAHVVNAQAGRRAFVIGERHYDTGNDLFERMLDKRMTYTCGFWKDAMTLDEAQEHKLDLVCKKIGLKKGDHVLDIGCGWGGFLIYAAEKYGVRGTGVTVSKEQAALAKERAKGLPIEIMVQDYRAVQGTFDHVISLGMVEHVGAKNHRTFMETVARVLKDDGLFLLHTIGSSKSELTGDPWFEKYIFPNSLVPSIGQIACASEGLFVMEDWHNFGAYYDPTLMAWYHNVEKAWPELSQKYSERFHRMWRFYLLSSAGMFRSRKGQLWQIVFAKNGVRGGYKRII